MPRKRGRPKGTTNEVLKERVKELPAVQEPSELTHEADIAHELTDDVNGDDFDETLAAKNDDYLPAPRDNGQLILDDRVQEVIVNAVRRGNYIAVAARLAGISRQTLHRWCRAGRKYPYSKYGKFLKAMNNALAEAEADKLNIINKAAESDWRAAEWWLSRKFPDRWGKKDFTQIESNQRTEVVVKYVDDFRAPDIKEVLTGPVIDVEAEEVEDAKK